MEVDGGAVLVPGMPANLSPMRGRGTLPTCESSMPRVLRVVGQVLVEAAQFARRQ